MQFIPVQSSETSRMVDTSKKVLLFFTRPLLSTVATCLVWRWVFYHNKWYLDPGLRDIVSSAWIPTLGILYSLLAAAMVTTVWNEYKAMRMSIKSYDIDTFMNLRDEDMGPVIIVILMGSTSFMFMLSFMILSYTTPANGYVIVGSVAFVLSVVFFVVREIDNPLSGIWVIKNVHPEWMDVDPKAWRQRRCQEKKETFTVTITQFSSQETK